MVASNTLRPAEPSQINSVLPSFDKPRGLVNGYDFTSEGLVRFWMFTTSSWFVKPWQAVPGMESYDVISINGVAIVSAKDGLYQYDYTNRSNLKLLSKTGYAN